MLRLAVLITSAFLVLTACGDEDPADDATVDPSDSDVAVGVPEVVDVEATQDDDGTWTFAVTVSSPYDSPEQYADAWRVVGPDGDELGLLELAHDHAGEQPFTRQQSGIEIADDVDVVTVEARDLVEGWSGETFEVELER